MKDILIISLATTIVLLLLLAIKFGESIYFTVIRLRLKEYLETISPKDYSIINNSKFRKNFHSALELTSRKKTYRNVSLLSDYTSKLSEILKELLKRESGTLEEIVSALKTLGYSDNTWILICKAMNKTSEFDGMLLRQIYWWPTLSNELPVDQYLKNTEDILKDASTDIMIRIRAFRKEIELYSTLMEYTDPASGPKNAMKKLEEMFVNFIDEHIQQSKFTIIELQGITYVLKLFDSYGGADGMARRINSQIDALERDFKNQKVAV